MPFWNRTNTPTSDAAPGFEPVVNGPSLTELFDEGGARMFVPSEEVDTWLTKGFSRAPVDVDRAVSELKPLANALAESYGAWLEEVKRSDGIDHSHATRIACHAAVGAFTEALARLEHAMNILYSRIEESEPVLMKNPDTGEAEAIDPGQVALYRGKGFRPVE